MPRRREPVEHAEIECAAPDCSVRFTPQRSTAKYHSVTCRNRAGRSRKSAAAEAKGEAATAEHGLVKSLRKELISARKLDSFDGQMALELARRAVAVDSNLAAFDKLEAARRRALGTSPAAPAGDEAAGAAEPDEVTKARAARDRKRAGLGEAPAG